MKIVKFKDGTYGIRDGNWFSGYVFYSARVDAWRRTEDYVKKFCRYPDYFAALSALSKAQKSIGYGKRDYGKPV